MLIRAIDKCQRVGLAQLEGGKRLSEVTKVRASLSKEVDQLIALSHRINSAAFVTYSRARVSVSRIAQEIVKRFSFRPPVPEGTPCAGELVERLQHSIAVAPATPGLGTAP